MFYTSKWLTANTHITVLIQKTLIISNNVNIVINSSLLHLIAMNTEFIT